MIPGTIVLSMVGGIVGVIHHTSPTAMPGLACM